MTVYAEHGFGPAIAAIAAGPVFCAALMLGLGYASLPAAIPVEPEALLIGPFLLIPATIAGALIAIVPCLIGCGLMAQLGRVAPFTRAAPFWVIAGMIPIAIGAAAAQPGPDDGPALFAFLATGAICALICRRFTKWSEAPVVRERPPARTVVSFAQGDVDPRLLR